jgi:hypothetical protein
MTRKDSEKEAERPHYYSQFWLDVAAGRRVIGAPKPGEENEAPEPEPAEPAPLRRPGRIQDEQMRADADGRAETLARPVAEPVAAPEEYIEPEPEESYSNDVDELGLQDVEDGEIPDMDLSPADETAEEEEEEEPEEDFFDEEEEEEEEESPWGSRSRKKAKPTRPIRQPKKPSRRDSRRSY